jgi:hypothetical protein
MYYLAPGLIEWSITAELPVLGNAPGNGHGTPPMRFARLCIASFDEVRDLRVCGAETPATFPKRITGIFRLHKGELAEQRVLVQL